MLYLQASECWDSPNSSIHPQRDSANSKAHYEDAQCAHDKELSSTQLDLPGESNRESVPYKPGGWLLRAGQRSPDVPRTSLTAGATGIACEAGMSPAQAFQCISPLYTFHSVPPAGSEASSPVPSKPGWRVTTPDVSSEDLYGGRAGSCWPAAKLRLA